MSIKVHQIKNIEYFSANKSLFNDTFIHYFSHIDFRFVINLYVGEKNDNLTQKMTQKDNRSCPSSRDLCPKIKPTWSQKTNSSPSSKSSPETYISANSCDRPLILVYGILHDHPPLLSGPNHNYRPCSSQSNPRSIYWPHPCQPTITIICIFGDD